jgi:hypothetical protein
MRYGSGLDLTVNKTQPCFTPRLSVLMNSHVGFAPGIFSTKQSLAHRTKRLSPPVFRCIEEGCTMPLTLRRADSPGSNYHVFAGTHSIMSKGGGMFDPTDTVIHERNKMEASQRLTRTA